MGPVADTSANSRRTIAFLIVIVVHIVLLYGFNAGLSSVIVEKVFGPMETQIIEEVKEEEERPPPPPPKLETPPPFVPPPDISIEVAPVENTTAIQVTTTQRPVETPPPTPARSVVKVNPKPDARRGGITKPEYPPSVRRAGGEGTVHVQCLVLENGRVGEARIQTSSGHPKLDEAVLMEAKRSWRFTPGTEDGKPVQAWVTVPIVFRLTDE
jgi:protein TonB